MTTRKQIRFCVILGLLALVGTGLVGSWITWGREAWMRLEFWLCVLALAVYLYREIRLVLRRRGESLLGDILEANLVCLSLYMLILEYWVFPMQHQMTGSPLPEGDFFRIVGKLIPFAILLGWMLLGRRGAGSVKTLLSGAIGPLVYLGGSAILVLSGGAHPYFFFDPMTVGQKGINEWLGGLLLLLPLILLFVAAAEYSLAMVGLWHTPAKKYHKQNINGRGTTK